MHAFSTEELHCQITKRRVDDLDHSYGVHFTFSLLCSDPSDSHTSNSASLNSWLSFRLVEDRDIAKRLTLFQQIWYACLYDVLDLPISSEFLIDLSCLEKGEAARWLRTKERDLHNSNIWFTRIVLICTERGSCSYHYRAMAWFCLLGWRALRLCPLYLDQLNSNNLKGFCPRRESSPHLEQ